MATLKSQLPPYCVIRRRKDYEVVYFTVPENRRPAGWKSPKDPVGNTRDHDTREIVRRGHVLYEELTAYRKAAARGVSPTINMPKGCLSDILRLYKKSEYWENLRPATQKSHGHHFLAIEAWCKASGHAHIKHLTAVQIAKFLDRYKGKNRTRRYYRSILSRLYVVAIREGFVTENVAKTVELPKAGRATKRKLIIWEAEDIARFVKKADEMGLGNVGTAVIIAFEGFRQTDIFNLQEPRDYRDGKFHFEASKTGADIICRAYPRTISRLAKRPKTQLLLTVNDSSGMQWGRHAFYQFFRDVLEAADMQGRQFRQIRNSAALYGLRAGLTNEEFEQRFGWPKETARIMLREFYTDIDQEIMNRAADKLIGYMSGREKS